MQTTTERFCMKVGKKPQTVQRTHREQQKKQNSKHIHFFKAEHFCPSLENHLMRSDSMRRCESGHVLGWFLLLCAISSVLDGWLQTIQIVAALEASSKYSERLRRTNIANRNCVPALGGGNMCTAYWIRAEGIVLYLYCLFCVRFYCFSYADVRWPRYVICADGSCCNAADI